MKIILSKSNNPYYNLSLEEMVLKDETMSDQYLMIYQNDNTIVVGRNQNIYEEINTEYINENKINLVRRVSGGGSVYHDGGNVNFSFITDKKSNSYAEFLEPIIEFLKSLGLDAKFHGKNDVHANGFKISGNAQYIYKQRMFHHGTLLFDSTLEVLSKALKPNKLKLESKSLKSIRQRVSNIRPLLNKDMDTKQFVSSLIDFFGKENLVDMDNYKSDELKALINVRKSDDWIFGKNPEFDVELEKRFKGGGVKIKLDILKNHIKDIAIVGDFLSTNDFEKIIPTFKGLKFDEAVISKEINAIEDFDQYFGKITKEELISVFKQLLVNKK
ncbi:MAG: lipoate--protein ligase [Mycoplasmataceae bacterium]|nr:lipoate--protein ligase [Mycoplasmataceae bacterium]